MTVWLELPALLVLLVVRVLSDSVELSTVLALEVVPLVAESVLLATEALTPAELEFVLPPLLQIP